MSSTFVMCVLSLSLQSLLRQTKGAWEENVLIVLNLLHLKKYFFPPLKGAGIFWFCILDLIFFLFLFQGNSSACPESGSTWGSAAEPRSLTVPVSVSGMGQLNYFSESLCYIKLTVSCRGPVPHSSHSLCGRYRQQRAHRESTHCLRAQTS